MFWGDHHHFPGNPPPVPLDRARAHLVEIQNALTPAHPILIGQQVDTVVAVLGRPRHADEDPDAWTDALVEALTAVPADLVVLACQRARTQLTFPPAPAELVALIRPEWARRRLAAMKIEGTITLARLNGFDGKGAKP